MSAPGRRADLTGICSTCCAGGARSRRGRRPAVRSASASSGHRTNPSTGSPTARSSRSIAEGIVIGERAAEARHGESGQRREPSGTTTTYWACRATPATRRSRAPTANSRSSTIPTATRATRTPRTSSRRRPRRTPMLADAEKRAAYDRFGHAGVSGAGRPAASTRRVHGLRGHLRTISAIFFGFGDVFGGGGGRRPAARRRTCATTSRSPSRSLPAASTPPSRFPAQEPCETCSGSGAARAPRPIAAPSARAAARCAISRGSSSWPGRAASAGARVPVIRTRARPAGAPARSTRERKLTVKIPPASPPASGSGCYGEGEMGAMGGPPGDCMSWSASRHTSSSGATATTCSARSPVNFPTLVLGGDITVPTLDGDETLKIPEGTSTGRVFHCAARGCPASAAAAAEICTSWSRRGPRASSPRNSARRSTNSPSCCRLRRPNSARATARGRRPRRVRPRQGPVQLSPSMRTAATFCAIGFGAEGPACSARSAAVRGWNCDSKHSGTAPDARLAINGSPFPARRRAPAGPRHGGSGCGDRCGH